MRIAVWGTFDVDNYGDRLFPLIAARELGRRLPGATVDAFGVRDLGVWSEARLDELAAGYDCVVVGGGEIIHLNDRMLAPAYGIAPEEMDRLQPSRFFVEGLGPRRERETPVLWNAVGLPFDLDPAGEPAARLRGALAHREYVAVRDPFSRARLAAAGVRPPRPVAVVPDTALLVDRLFPEVRRGGDAVVVQGCDLLVPHAADVAAALATWSRRRGDAVAPVVVETGPCRGDGRFADAFEAAWPGPVRRLDAGETGDPSWPGQGRGALGELAAVIAGAGLFVGSSMHGAITAVAYGRPFVLLNLAGESKLDGFGVVAGAGANVVHAAAQLPGAIERAVRNPPPAAVLARLQCEVDAHFDRMAAVARA